MRTGHLKRFLAVALLGACVAGLRAQTPNLTSVDVGLPLLEGSTTTSDGRITIVGGGDDIWNNADNFHYAYTTVTGDFDYAVQVEDLQGPDNWSKAELMARQVDPVFGPEGGDPHISNMTTRSGGQNQLAPQFRTQRDGGSDWVSPVGTPRPTYPDTWLRIERLGDVFYLYHSSDGENWSLYEPSGTVDTGGDPIPTIDPWFLEAWPDTIAIGLAVTAHNDSDPNGATAVFSNFGPYEGTPISITTQPPATHSVSQNEALRLSVDAEGDPIHYQWRKDGVDIPGAIDSTYTVDLAKTDDAGTYSVRLYASGQEVISDDSVVTVTADTQPPQILSANPDETFRSVLVQFSEPVDSSAETASNYSLDKGVSVSGVSRVDGDTVKLTTNRMAEDEEYTLTVNNVKDTASPANTIAAGSTATFRSFVFQVGAVLHKFWENVTPNNLDALRNDPRFPDAPSWVSIEPRWEYPPGGGNEAGSNYGNQLVGWFIPPQDGAYVFFTNSDDPSDLYLSTDDDPANKYLIARESGWSGARQWVSVGGGSNVDDKRSDFFLDTEWPGTPWTGIELQGGQRYYMESIHTEGGGGDNLGATFIMLNEPDPANGDPSRITGSAVGAYLNPNGASVSFDQHPQDVSAPANRTATFTVQATGTSAYGPTVSYQWQTAPAGSSNFTDISGATSDTYTTDLLTAADEGRQYRVIARVPSLSETSEVATLSVISDTTAPSVVAAFPNKAGNRVFVRFSEALDEATAAATGNYTLTSGGSSVAVTGATASLDPNNNTRVVLTTAQQPAGGSLSLALSGIEDRSGNTITAGSQITLGPAAKAVLFAVGTTPPNNSDTQLIAHMEARDFEVTVVEDANTQPSDADNKDLIVISSTCSSGDITTDYQMVAIPVINWEQALQDDFITVNPTDGSVRGEVGSQDSISIINADHPLAAGLAEGVHEVTTTPVTFTWGEPAASAVRIATIEGNPGQTCIYLIEEGQPLFDGTPAPANRYHIFYQDDAFGASNEKGVALFDAMLSHALGIEVQLPSEVSVARDGDDVVITWDRGALVGSPTVDGPYTPVAGATSPHRVTPSESAMFFQAQQ